MFVIERRRVGVLFLEPPCMDFSSAKHPASRSYGELRGVALVSEKTRAATRLALRVLSMSMVAWRSNVPTLLEQPLLSKTAWLPEWVRLRQWAGVEERFAASRAFLRADEFREQLFLKRFRFLTVHMREASSRLERSCPGCHVHTRLSGRAAARSAVYNVGLTQALADVSPRTACWHETRRFAPPMSRAAQNASPATTSSWRPYGARRAAGGGAAPATSRCWRAAW